MIISVASGKGGTGKTTVAVNLAMFLEQNSNEKTSFLDCDVEEPNAYIFLKPEIAKKTFFGIPIPEVNFSKCDYCGKCSEVCAYNAIVVIKKNVLVFPELCHGCGGCSLLCPQKAISEKDKEIGFVKIGNSGGIKFFQGQLNVGEPMATPLIRFVKKIGLSNDKNTVYIIDAPPGTSCPVIETVKGSDFTILVTEPTPFGLNDLKLAVGVLRKLTIPFGVIINLAGSGDMGVNDYIKIEDIPLLGEIPYDRKIAVLYSYGIPMLKEGSKYINIFDNIWKNLNNIISTPTS